MNDKDISKVLLTYATHKMQSGAFNCYSPIRIYSFKGVKTAELLMNYIIKTPNGVYVSDFDLNKLTDVYDKITPLFEFDYNSDAENEILSFMSGYSTHRAGVYSDYSARALIMGLHSLCRSFDSLSNAYLVCKNGLYGVIDIFGKIIVDCIYESVLPLPIKHTYEYGDSTTADFWGEDMATTGFYVCKTSRACNNLDIYDINGNLIFTGVDRVYPNIQLLCTAEKGEFESDDLLPSSKTVKSILVAKRKYEPELLMDVDETLEFSVEELQQTVKADGNFYAPKQVHKADFSCNYLYLPLSLLQMYEVDLQSILEKVAISFECTDETHKTFESVYEYILLQAPIDGINADSSIDDLELSVAAYKALKDLGILSARDLVKLGEETICSVKRTSVVQEILLLKKRLSISI